MMYNLNIRNGQTKTIIKIVLFLTAIWYNIREPIIQVRVMACGVFLCVIVPGAFVRLDLDHAVAAHKVHTHTHTHTHTTHTHTTHTHNPPLTHTH